MLKSVKSMVIAVIFSMILSVAPATNNMIPATTVEAASVKTVTVKTDKQLKKALRNKKIDVIRLESKGNVTIPKGSYAKSLIINKATTVINKGQFVDIELKKVKSFKEQADDNEVKISGNTNVIVDRKSEDDVFSFGKKNVKVNFTVNGSVEGIECNRKATIKLNINRSGYVYNISFDVPDVAMTVNNNGSMGNVDIYEYGQFILEGNGDHPLINNNGEADITAPEDVYYEEDEESEGADIDNEIIEDDDDQAVVESKPENNKPNGGNSGNSSSSNGGSSNHSNNGGSNNGGASNHNNGGSNNGNHNGQNKPESKPEPVADPVVEPEVVTGSNVVVNPTTEVTTGSDVVVEPVQEEKQKVYILNIDNTFDVYQYNFVGLQLLDVTEGQKTPVIGTTWEISNDNFTKVYDYTYTGIGMTARAMELGETTITATAPDGQSKSVTLNVVEAPEINYYMQAQDGTVYMLEQFAEYADGTIFMVLPQHEKNNAELLMKRITSFKISRTRNFDGANEYNVTFAGFDTAADWSNGFSARVLFDQN